MQRENCRKDMKVFFGRTRGEKTLGKVKKCNPTKAKIETLEHRGNGRGCEPGSIWNVPYELIEPADESDVAEAPSAKRLLAKCSADDPIPSFDLLPGTNYHILSAILCIYNDLSPENLCCDGEISVGEARKKADRLRRKLQALFTAYGREVSETAAWAWEEKRQVMEKV